MRQLRLSPPHALAISVPSGIASSDAMAEGAATSEVWTETLHALTVQMCTVPPTVPHATVHVRGTAACDCTGVSVVTALPCTLTGAPTTRAAVTFKRRNSPPASLARQK